jgi:hypothetical protein
MRGPVGQAMMEAAGRAPPGPGRHSARQLGGAARGRVDLGPKPRVRGEGAVEPEEVEPGRRDQHAEFLDELQGVEQQMGGAELP